MDSLEAELEKAQDLDVGAIADAIEHIGFECTRCGACCKAVESDEGEMDHTATVFPDEVRRLQERGDYDWRDVARPMPFGLTEKEDNSEDESVDEDEPAGENEPVDEGEPANEEEPEVEDESVDEDEPVDEDGRQSADDRQNPDDRQGGTGTDGDGLQGETFEWALQTDDCGDCTFYEESDGQGACTVHEDRPLICRTYPFSVALGGTSQPMGEAVDREGMVRAHECEGLGRDISRADAEDLAATLKERAIRELEEAIAVRDNYEPTDADGVVVHDSEGAKRPNGERVEAGTDGAIPDRDQY